MLCEQRPTDAARPRDRLQTEGAECPRARRCEKFVEQCDLNEQGGGLRAKVIKIGQGDVRERLAPVRQSVGLPSM